MWPRSNIRHAPVCSGSEPAHMRAPNRADSLNRRNFLVTASAAVPLIRPFAARPLSRETFDVRAFGARGDGKTDDIGPFTTALEAAGRVHGIVRVPGGRYV